jgi:hypothetical protein
MGYKEKAFTAEYQKSTNERKKISLTTSPFPLKHFGARQGRLIFAARYTGTSARQVTVGGGRDDISAEETRILPYRRYPSPTSSSTHLKSPDHLPPQPAHRFPKRDSDFEADACPWWIWLRLGSPEFQTGVGFRILG